MTQQEAGWDLCEDNRNSNRVRNMQNCEFAWLNRDGRKIFAQYWQPEGKTRGNVVLVHGLGEHSGRYRHIADAFTRAGYALFAMDLPGHGRSEGPRGFASFDEIMLDIDRLRTEASSRNPGPDGTILPQFLYGHSMGGAVILYYTLKRRPDVLGVISSSPGLAPGFKVPGAKVLLAKLMARLMPSFAMANGLDRQNLSRDPQVVADYGSDPLVHDRISALLGLDVLTRGEWITDSAGEFPVPLLLVQGSLDHLVSPEATARFAQVVPPDRLTYKVWEGFYHETHNEPEKQMVVQFMLDWMAKQQARPADSAASHNLS